MALKERLSELRCFKAVLLRLIKYKYAAMAQLVERVLGKDEVTGSIPVSSSKLDRVEPRK